MHESQMHEANSFLTLTLDRDHLPRDWSLRKAHLQDFYQAVRNWQRSRDPHAQTIRYFSCGEYGESFNRPHYHAAIFGEAWTDDRRFHKNTENGDPLYRSETLETLWGKGEVLIGDLTFTSAAYVAKYVTKKVNGYAAREHYHGRQPEFTLMSKRPGLGSTWLDAYYSDVYPRDEVVANGHIAPPPKYYDARLKKREPELYEAIKQSRKATAEDMAWNNTPERLAVRKQVTTARMGLYKRKDL